MHIWQAIKMACKSLWTNKLRSFLTMLGIIIGVMTVALLTSVASGVQKAVISQIRTQSTLTIVMNTSNNMTYSKITEVLKSEQPDEDADDYFTYSIIKNSRSVIASDLTDISQDVLSSDPSSFLSFEKLLSYSDDEMESMTPEEKMFAQMHNMRKKPRPISSSIYAVDKNFADVYDLKLQYGEFPEETDELLVDEEFIKTYLGEDVDLEDAVGQNVSIGVTYYSTLKIKFADTATVDETTFEQICNWIEKKYVTGQDGEGNDILGGSPVALTILANGDGTKYTYDSATKTLSINYEFFQNMTDAQAIGFIAMCPEVSSNISNPTDVSVSDVYDKTNAKDYEISGVLEDEDTMFSGMSMTSSGEEGGLASSMLNLMMSNQKGNCYMLLDERNLAPIGATQESVDDIVISYAYLRYKTEDVMADSATSISLALMQAQFGYMTDFMVISMSSVASIVDSVMNTLTIMLTTISIVSLIIGGIGIMNIMLVAVTERTREIGIRKAIGAKKSAILMQFLVEALMLSLLGGAIGLGISAIGCAIIGHFMGISIGMPFWVIGMSVGFCTAIGLLFGMFPAIKASRMQPIDALRRE